MEKYQDYSILVYNSEPKTLSAICSIGDMSAEEFDVFKALFEEQYTGIYETLFMVDDMLPTDLKSKIEFAELQKKLDEGRLSKGRERPIREAYALAESIRKHRESGTNAGKNEPPKFIRREMEEQEANREGLAALAPLMIPVPGKEFMFAASEKGNPQPAPNVTVNIGNLNELRNAVYEGNVMAAHTKEVDKWHTSSMEKHGGTGWCDLVDEYFPELRNDIPGRGRKAKHIEREVKALRKNISDDDF